MTAFIVKAQYWFLWLHKYTVVELFKLLLTLVLHLHPREQNDTVCTAEGILEKLKIQIW